MPRKKVSIDKLAKQLKISNSTVSRALNGRPGVSESLRQEILRLAKVSGYVSPRHTEDSVEMSRNIAMIIGDVRNPFYAELVYSVQKVLNTRGYMLSIFNSDYDQKDELRYMKMLERFHFDGVIEVCVSSESSSAQLESLRIPIVMVNRMLSTFDTDVVLMDNYEAGYIATRHLLENGHSRIAYLIGQRTSPASMLRYEGYLQIMRNYNLPVIDEYQLNGDLTLEKGYEVAQQAISTWTEMPTAIVISNDLSAYGFLAYCNEANIRVPEDISIVSFDNTRFSAIMMPPLTTVDAHTDEMGTCAAEMMLDRLASPESPRRRQILKPTLVERKSVKCIL